MITKRKKPTNFNPIKDLRECDTLLSQAAQLNREIISIENTMNEAIDAAKQIAEAESFSLKKRIEEIERSLKAYAQYNKADLFDKAKSIELMHGSLGFRKLTKIKQLKGVKVPDSLEKLHEFGFTEAIRTGKESINKPVMIDWSDEKLKSVGQSRDISDEFWYEIKQETVEVAS